MKVESIRRTDARRETAAAPVLETLRNAALALWKQAIRATQRPPRRLRLCENLPLGDRRFVAVIEYEHSRFLVGGTPGSLVLLAQLGNPSPNGASSQPEPTLAGEAPQ